MDILKENCRWYVAHGCCACILDNPWISKLRLGVDTVMFNRLSIDPRTKISHFIISVRKWNTARLGAIIYPLLVRTISAISILHTNSEDVVHWHDMASGSSHINHL